MPNFLVEDVPSIPCHIASGGPLDANSDEIRQVEQTLLLLKMSLKQVRPTLLPGEAMDDSDKDILDWAESLSSMSDSKLQKLQRIRLQQALETRIGSQLQRPLHASAS